MIRRLYNRAVVALVGLFIPNIDNVVSGLERTVSRLDRAADRANAAMAAEQRLREASHNRQTAALARYHAQAEAENAARLDSFARESAATETAMRATRVRERVRSLIA
jgi:hypothetical protein